MAEQYVPGERRRVLFRLGPAWRRGTLRGWYRGTDGWVAFVRYPTGPPVPSSRFDTIPAAWVRDATPCEACPAAQRRFVVEVLGKLADAG